MGLLKETLMRVFVGKRAGTRFKLITMRNPCMCVTVRRLSKQQLRRVRHGA